MAYLHENKEEFITAINLSSEKFGILPSVAEKDYYVTLILRKLSEKTDYIVFKGGTSLSKCYKVIKRFSEDIDITIDTKLSQGQMKKIKSAIKEIADELRLSIPNIDDTRSRITLFMLQVYITGFLLHKCQNNSARNQLRRLRISLSSQFCKHQNHVREDA